MRKKYTEDCAAVELERLLTECKEWQCGSAVEKLQVEVELTCFSLFFQMLTAVSVRICILLFHHFSLTYL